MTPEIENHLTAGMNMRKKDIMLGNFLGGLSWGLGTVIGATVVVAILIGVLRVVNFIPVLGNFGSQVLQAVEQRQTPPNLTR